jgi:hypothetical protein
MRGRIAGPEIGLGLHDADREDSAANGTQEVLTEQEARGFGRRLRQARQEAAPLGGRDGPRDLGSTLINKHVCLLAPRCPDSRPRLAA